MVSPQSLPPAERALYSKLHKLLTYRGLLRGNLVQMQRRCGKKTCRCQKGSAFLHRSLYLALSLNGKRRMIYVPADWEARVRQWVERQGQVRELIEEISLMYLKRLQNREG